ncbi:alpha/beta hydrolase [Halobaculum sp. MBLA0147]|uniref:alpha/beta hydrolase n=1 Tax=Halobaculum sp. MBLA0147 TaxID=3079934 RepID=UPI0035250961
MQRHTYGDPDDRDLLVVLGWGNRPEHDPVDWLLSQLAADWHVHAVVVPENGTDFERDYRAPLTEINEAVDPAATLAHSLGCLALAHVPGDDSRVYASPFWGTNDDGLVGALLPLVARLPVERRVIPGETDPDQLGALKPADETGAAERGISPAWLRAVRGAQATLPPFREGSVVYCSLRDTVVGVRAVGDHAPADRIRLYDGGHEFFASASRERTLDRVRADLRAVADGRTPVNSRHGGDGA